MTEPVDAERSLEERLARAAGAVPGVARLEPSLAHAIRGLARLGRSPSTAEADSPDGISVTRRADAVDVAVEISVAGPRTALETVRAELTLASLGGGAVNVRVLSVDAAERGPGPGVPPHPLSSGPALP